MSMIPEEIPLGFYECPYPYKRIISPELLKWCAESKRFFFIKDTSCNLENIKQKLEAIQGSTIKLFNANSSTLFETLQMGASGFSGVMANFHTDLYVWLCKNYKTDSKKSRILADFLTISSLIERQVYPVNAKYCQQKIGNFQSMFTRTKNTELLNDTGKLEVDQLMRLTEFMRDFLKITG